MQKYLMILEVSRKQDYIFKSQKLRDNVTRSAEIRFVTDEAFFFQEAGDLYRPENMVYSGGGHTVLQFDDPEQAKEFAAVITETVLRQYTGLELFVKLMPYCSELTPGENLKELTRQLEMKKSRRRASFHRCSFGVEALDRITFCPVSGHQQRKQQKLVLEVPGEKDYTLDFEENSFIAVIHVDGNAMGGRVNSIYQAAGNNWDDCCARLHRFSEEIQRDFEQSFQEMCEELLMQDQNIAVQDVLPVRPVILAGDDVCFVTRGDIGLECARIFLEKLSAKTNQEDGKPYSACAGVAVVHRKYPFHRAYGLAEELCDNAKKFASKKDPQRCISAMDWHIEFGQLKDSLSEIRKDYRTEDGCRLELRPVTVVIPKSVQRDQETDFRSYFFIRNMHRALRGEYGRVARSKIKELRNVMKQGEVETSYFMADQKINGFLYHCFDARYDDCEERIEQFRQMIRREKKVEKIAFFNLGEEKRSLFFDAIELIDHAAFWGEAKE